MSTNSRFSDGREVHACECYKTVADLIAAAIENPECTVAEVRKLHRIFFVDRLSLYATKAIKSNLLKKHISGTG